MNISKGFDYSCSQNSALVTYDVNEALYLSDEIVVFSANPGTIRYRFIINSPRPRRRSDPELSALEQRIGALFKYDIDYESEYAIWKYFVQCL